MRFDLCNFSDIFGKPNEGPHSIRLFGVAIIDVIFTIFGALILWYLFGRSVVFWFIILFVLGIIMHRIFCVRTTIDKLLFD